MAVTDQAPSNIDSNVLAVDRTIMAYERTLMAWIRTAMSMITFGFSIHKFFQYLLEKKISEGGGHLLGSKMFGLGMISVGILSLVLAIWQQRRGIARLPAPYSDSWTSLATIIALVIIALGIAGFVIVILNL